MTVTSFHEELFPKGSGVISLVGGGGKTTLMFRLAAELARNKETVLTTTTTKIFEPTEEQSTRVIVSEDPDEVLRNSAELLHHTAHITAARERLVSMGKLSGFESVTIEFFMKKGGFQWVLVEADGAARKPIKAPAEHEPVIPECSSCVIAVIGLDAIGKPLDDRWVFRPRLYSQVTGISIGSPVTERSVASVIMADRGLMKGCPPDARRLVFLNKAEGEERLAAGQKVASFLKKEGKGKIDRILIGSAEEGRLRTIYE
ncbi:MAG: putative selenium-dependent hydroxylase accessory protein YqeC [Deltaproteobacteria bacterium]|nr:putative selenium-dependent hydroxylase accessory protein YqeC [Deltaproteobacteria bacterium]